NWFVFRRDEYPTYPVRLKRAPGPRRDQTEFLCGLLADLIYGQLRERFWGKHWTKPRVHELGWKWKKPIILDEGWRHGAADVWNPVADSACIDPDREHRKPWPYPRPALSFWQQQRLAHTQLDSSKLRTVLPRATSGDLARITKMRLKE